MKHRVSMIAIILFVLFFVQALYVSNNIYLFAWFIAMLTIPLCALVPDVTAILQEIIFLEEYNDIHIDIVLLLVIGILQYGFVGFIIDLIISKLKVIILQRSSRHTASHDRHQRH